METARDGISTPLNSLLFLMQSGGREANRQMPPRRRQPRKGGKARRRQAPERPACENRPLFVKKHPENIMDAERINQIGSQIADLTARTAELRGYL